MKSIVQETREQYNTIKFNISKGNEDTLPYLSGTLNKRIRMYKEIARYEEYANIDHNFGIITDDQYKTEIKAVRIFERALANYSVY